MSTRKKEKNNDDDDGGTVIDRKLIIFNNINTNSRFNNGATDADATAAIAVILPLTVAVLRAFELFKRSFYFMIDRPNIETGKTWSVFNLSNQNWAGCSSKFNVPYVLTVVLYGSTQRQS